MIATGDNWTLHLGDCIEGMRGLEDDSVDCVITDPPYSEGLYRKWRSNGSVFKKGGAKGKPDEFRRHVEMADLAIGSLADEAIMGLAAEFLRVARRWVVVFSDQESTHTWRAGMADSYIRTGIWAKTNPTPQITGDRPGMGFEPATIGHRKGRKRWNGGGKAAVWHHAICTTNRPDHPCPKPLPLMYELVSLFSDPDELVLDPFAGSGSTGVACNQLGRRFVGWELSPEYHAIACRRLRGDEAKPNPAQPSLFGRTA
jgi:DNA modification methylase